MTGSTAGQLDGDRELGIELGGEMEQRWEMRCWVVHWPRMVSVCARAVSHLGPHHFSTHGRDRLLESFRISIVLRIVRQRKTVSFRRHKLLVATRSVGCTGAA
jgi:hypothetical protein